jgi:hypothetical protein
MKLYEEMLTSGDRAVENRAVETGLWRTGLFKQRWPDAAAVSNF